MMQKYNWECNIVKDSLTEDEAYKYEKELIKYYRENTNYRLTNIADGGRGAVFSGQIREEMSNKYYRTKEFREKISKLVSGENNPNYNHKWPKEKKEMLRIKQKNNPLYYGKTNPNAKKMICLETGKIYECIKEAMKDFNVKSQASFVFSLQDKARTVNGKYHFAYITEENEHLFCDEKYRFQYLIECYKSARYKKAILDIENKSIYKSKQEFRDIVGISERALD